MRPPTSPCPSVNNLNFLECPSTKVFLFPVGEESCWQEQVKHGLSIGVTSSSDSKSPFFGAEFNPNGHKNFEIFFEKNHNDLTKKIQQTY